MHYEYPNDVLMKGKKFIPNRCHLCDLAECEGPSVDFQPVGLYIRSDDDTRTKKLSVKGQTFLGIDRQKVPQMALQMYIYYVLKCISPLWIHISA